MIYTCFYIHIRLHELGSESKNVFLTSLCAPPCELSLHSSMHLRYWKSIHVNTNDATLTTMCISVSLWPCICIHVCTTDATLPKNYHKGERRPSRYDSHQFPKSSCIQEDLQRGSTSYHGLQRLSKAANTPPPLSPLALPLRNLLEHLGSLPSLFFSISSSLIRPFSPPVCLRYIPIFIGARTLQIHLLHFFSAFISFLTIFPQLRGMEMVRMLSN